ncbi:MAG: recombinase family protein [Niastella sp.]|nr:recombinase family protein [Niastella sp.]
MASAILYIRVSTDEQAEKGYSLRHQEDALRSYCACQKIEILEIYQEDYSAKNFNRPVWKRMMAGISNRKNREPLFLLFTKWDRFSRNAGDSYMMIRTLNALQVIPQAIEQPIDPSVPENKVMMAMFLSIPEAENDRRGLEVKKGMRKAQEEGRWMGKAPLGYHNIFSPKGAKMIVPKEPECKVIAKLFEKLAMGGVPVNTLYLEALDRGLHCSRTNFYLLLRNPVYAGLITVSADKKADRKIVIGQHMGIITKTVFDIVQQRLRQTETRNGTGKRFSLEYPLKGYMCCPICNKKLTASASKGRRIEKYKYYHCKPPCRCHLPAESTTNLFWNYVTELRPLQYYIDVFERFLTEVFTTKSHQVDIHKAKMGRKVDVLLNRLKTLNEMLLDNVLEYQSFVKMKKDLQSKIDELSDGILGEQQQLQKFVAGKKNYIWLFSHLDKLYQQLNEHGKPRFLTWLLNKDWKWNPDHFHQLIKNPLQVVYGLRSLNGADADLQNEAEEGCHGLVYLIEQEMMQELSLNLL